MFRFFVIRVVNRFVLSVNFDNLGWRFGKLGKEGWSGLAGRGVMWW